MKTRIILKSGAHIDLDLASVKTKRSPLDNNLMALEWEYTPGSTTRLFFVELDQVAAVVTVHDATDGSVGEVPA